MKRKHIILAMIFLCAAFIVHEKLPDGDIYDMLPEETCEATRFQYVTPTYAFSLQTSGNIVSIFQPVQSHRTTNENDRSGSMTTSAGKYISGSLLSRYFHILPDFSKVHVCSRGLLARACILLI